MKLIDIVDQEMKEYLKSLDSKEEKHSDILSKEGFKYIVYRGIRNTIDEQYCEVEFDNDEGINVLETIYDYIDGYEFTITATYAYMVDDFMTDYIENKRR